MSAVARVTAAYAAIARPGGPRSGSRCARPPRPWPKPRRSTPRVAAGEPLPLAGLVAAVKDNIDVAGLPTTAGAPSYEYLPARGRHLRSPGCGRPGRSCSARPTSTSSPPASSAPAARTARFATHGIPRRISGGSSSGSAVAVALGLVDFALGTDTAGSGRVPAALNGIVGLKPTRGVIPCTGVVPACRSLDCVTVFARSVPLATPGGRGDGGPRRRGPAGDLLGSGPRGALAPPGTRPVPAPGDAGQLRLAIPLPAQLAGLADGWAEAFEAAVARLRSGGRRDRHGRHRAPARGREPAVRRVVRRRAVHGGRRPHPRARGAHRRRP